MVNVIPEVELCNKQSIEVNHMIHPNFVEWIVMKEESLCSTKV